MIENQPGLRWNRKTDIHHEETNPMTRTPRFPTGLALCLSILATASEGSAQTQSITQEYRLWTLPGGRVAVPSFQYGLLVFLHLPDENSPQFTLIDPAADKVVARIRVSAPEAVETFPADLAVFPDRQRFVISAAARHESNRRSLWLLFCSADGTLTRSVRITPFQPLRIRVAPDGTVWGFGWNVKTAEDPNSEEPVLYQFSDSGEVLRKIGSQKDVMAEPNPATGQQHGSPYLAVSADRVAAFGAGNNTVLEASLDGKTMKVHRTVMPVEPGGRLATLIGLAITPAGEIYAGVNGIRRLDRDTGAWAPVTEPEALAQGRTIFGSAGNQILIDGLSGDRFHYRLVTLK